jgi:hypothetical protein
LNTEDLIGSHHKTPMPVRYNNHNIRSVLTAKHQGQLDTSITNNQQSTHDKPTSFAGKQILGKKKKNLRRRLARTSTELQNRPEISKTCRQYLKQKKNTKKQNRNSHWKSLETRRSFAGTCRRRQNRPATTKTATTNLNDDRKSSFQQHNHQTTGFFFFWRPAATSPTTIDNAGHHTQQQELAPQQQQQ